MNKVILVGRLTKDPELRTTQSGISVCSFTVACDRRYQKQGEERQTDFINCIAWRQQADFICKFFSKGVRIALDGSIQTRSWDAQDGTKRYATEVVVEHAEFAQSKAEGSVAPTAYAESQNSQSYASAPAGDIEGFMPVEEEDLPF